MPPAAHRPAARARSCVHRAAFAASGEYTQYFGGTVPNAQAAIVTVVNRLNQIYETEVAVRLVLVANNTSIIFTNAGTDPYNNSCDDADSNQAVVDGAIGSANYDVGHVVTTGSGGCAYLGVVGVNGQKARGTTGTNPPTNDPFIVDYVAHEVGHEYGGDHTFAGTRGSCSGNGNSSTAYEVGSGTSIMAYGGICGLDDTSKVVSGTVGASDPYFNAASFDQILDQTTAGAPGDIGAQSTGNAVPTAAAGADGTIPARTPFLLRGSGTDANNDPLTYEWQQRDLGGLRTLDNPNVASGALFREVVPTSSPVRYLPKLSSVVAGTTNIPSGCPALTATLGVSQTCWSEYLPSVSRSLHFRLTTRDNKAGGGGVNNDDITVTVSDTGAPFAVTSQSSAVSYGGNTSQTVTWNVAGTASAPINASTVDILLSTDGGATFPTTLVSGTPNDGTQAVTLPSAGTTTARIMVVQSGAGTGVRFFNVNAANFTITAALPELRVVTSPALPAEISVDGTVRDSWGLNWVRLPSGNHLVCFRPVSGYTEPPCQVVNLVAGTTSSVTGTYTPNGYLRAITSPAVPSTVSIDGVARNDWGVWTEIAPGSHQVCFGAVAGYDAPSCRDVVVAGGSTATTTGTFQVNPAAPGPSGDFGYLRATTDPANNAMITVDGFRRDNWGLNWLKLDPGAHTYCFGPSLNLTEPDCHDVTITPGLTSTVNGTFLTRGFLRVVTSPAVPANITVNGVAANAWGMWTSKEPGSYDVCFGDVPGYTTPPCQNGQTVTAGNTTTVTGTYTAIP
ncbi:MAG: M12 family metallo-peptidase [Acidimicrobiales bacterium]